MNANQILQRGAGIGRDGVRTATRLGARAAGEAYGLARRAVGLGGSPKPDMDDVTLTRKVETELFRDPDAPKATVNVNVVDGVVWLRGEVKHPEQVRDLETAAQSVPEVRSVENLLHLPKTPAPTRADTPRRQQRTRSSTRRPAPRRKQPAARVTDDRTDGLTPEHEPAPTERAKRRQGRTAAPMGSRPENGGGTSGPGGAA